MKAAYFESFGSAQDSLIVGSWENPQPKHNEVLVRLATSGVNPSDVKKRAGSFPDLLDGGAVIPHSDGAGVIESVGAGVPEARVGERVFVYQAQYGRRFGTACEYVCVESERAPMLPEEASFEIGACIGIPIMTAHRCVYADGPVAGQTLLVTGGAGRVGYYAIQWAKHGGAHVVATASNDADRDACLAVGADHVVNHRDSSWSQALLDVTQGKRVDRAVDVEFGQNLPKLLQCLRTGATIATYSSTVVKEPALPFLQMMFMDLTIRMVIVYAMPEAAKQQAVTETTAMLRNAQLKHRIAHTLPLDQIVLAHELIEQGGFGGCVVLDTR